MWNRNPDVVEFVGTVHDVTYRKKVEETILLQASAVQADGTEIPVNLPKRK